MRITHSSEMVKEFADIMLSQYYNESKKRSGLHRSDALSCPLKAFYRLTGKIQPIYSSQSVGTLLLGTLAHIAMHQNFDAQEKQFDLHGITITIDAIYGKYPIETKTTRRKIYRREDIPQEWIEQLAVGMAVMNVDKGYLMVLNVINFSLTVWEVEMNEEERQMFLNGCIWQIASILDAINKQDPSLLTPKHSECYWCPYKPLRSRPDGCIYYKPVSKKQLWR